MSHFLKPITPACLTWRDGVPYSAAFEDIYFSIENGIAESQHVYIEANQLQARFRALPCHEPAPFVIAETGFGTGLNFLLTCAVWIENAPASASLTYYSSEQFPLSLLDLKQCLALWPQLASLSEELIAQYPVLTPGYHRLSLQGGRIQLILMLGDVLETYQQLLRTGDHRIESTVRSFHVNAWYLDAFSPLKNEAMWRDELFLIMRLLSAEGTTVSTYSSASAVKTRLAAHGFMVERVAGFGQKKHMLLGEWDASYPIPHRRNRLISTPWHCAALQKNTKARRAIVLGGGLAGCFTAHALAKRQWDVTLLESRAQVGMGASGNRQAVLYPQLSIFRSPLIDLMLSAFLFATRFYRPLLGKSVEGELNGMLQLASNSRESVSQSRLKAWLSHYPSLGRLVDADEAALLSGVPIKEGGLYIPDSGWINSQSLCEYLIQDSRINVQCGLAFDALIYEDREWKLGDQSAPVLIVANGYSLNQFKQTAWIPVKKVAGQMSYFEASEKTRHLKLPICGEGHLLPAVQNQHAFGATYHLNADHCMPTSDDDILNAKRLVSLPIDWNWEPVLSEHWAGIRAATPDYLPVVGPLAIPEAFFNIYDKLAQDARRFIPAIAQHHPGLFVCAGFGSRGLTTIPLAAELLASMITEEPPFLPESMTRSLSPSRFLRQQIIQQGP